MNEEGFCSFSHMSSIRSKVVKEKFCRNDSKLAMVLGVENGVSSERFSHIFVEICWEWQLRVQIIHQRPAVITH